MNSVGCGLASSFYGEPRFTQDIDIVINISYGDSFNQLVSSLTQRFIIDINAAENAVRNNRLFQALHQETMIKVDFHVGEAIVGELNRSQIKEILPEVNVHLVSKENAILSKLIWIGKGSHKSRQDIKMMLKRPGSVDLNYIEKQAVKLGVENIFIELRSELFKEES